MEILNDENKATLIRPLKIYVGQIPKLLKNITVTNVMND